MISPSTLEQHLAPTMHPAVQAALSSNRRHHRPLLSRLGLRPLAPTDDTPPGVPITIRAAGEADSPALARLQQLDGHRLPGGPRLIAEVGGRPVAAAEIRTGSTVADPFSPSAGLVSLLRLRADQLRPRVI
jgi:hypothetical protein